MKTIMNLCEQHFRKTERLVRALSVNDIASWLLNEGYYPEQNILPPSFHVDGHQLEKKEHFSQLDNLKRKDLVSVSFPKTSLSNRCFSIQDPKYYHDIVFHLCQNWGSILDHLFREALRIFSYSLPIPVNSRNEGEVGKLRSGRLIYEWLAMAERDLALEAHKYHHIIRADINNFYPSVYTHSIAWATHDRESALKDKNYTLYGNKLDRLFQYANDARTNGIPIGPAVSDLIAEIILADIDFKISKEIAVIEFVATRFKDDYRILCKSQEDARSIIRIMSHQLEYYNLRLNEKKTVVLNLPEGIYRQHDRDYFRFSLKASVSITFKEFEHTLLVALDIHRRYPGTSLLEKFLSELYTRDKELKIRFNNYQSSRIKQIKKTINLLILLKRESPKILCHLLALFEALYDEYHTEFDFKTYLQQIIKSEIRSSANEGSIFELNWYVFFTRYLGLGITDFNELGVSKKLRDNEFLKSMIQSKQYVFSNSQVNLFRKPKDCRDTKLRIRLDVFNREELD